jgi:hypothetical protein
MNDKKNPSPSPSPPCPETASSPSSAPPEKRPASWPSSPPLYLVGSARMMPPLPLPEPSLTCLATPSAWPEKWSDDELAENLRKLCHLHQVLPIHAAVIGMVIDNLIAEHWILEVQKKQGS